APALARTAAALQEDNDALDALAAGHLAALRSDDGLAVTGLEDLPAALRRRVIRGWLLDVGATALTDVQLRAVDALVGDWHGQGGTAVPSPLRYQRLVVTRRAGMLTVAARPV
ncbi:MAG: TilS substrate-binding domain-containing protein, partial [Actinobacteria bacterium]|nr:TilS substrate-binding domain-containing protein [Actinomycetota bacterium]